MNRTDQPAKLHLCHDELHTLKRVFRARPVVQQQQDAGDYLNHKQKKRHAAEVIPDRLTVKRHFLFLGCVSERAYGQTLIQPVFERLNSHRVSQALLTTTSSPRLLTGYSSSGRGGGPPMFSPLRLY